MTDSTKEAPQTDQGYTGKEKDEETGLNYYGARYYDSALGRFISVDPVVLDNAKISKVSLSELLIKPQFLNSYTYAGNNPVRYNDPTGEYVETAIDLIFWVLSARDFYFNPGFGTGIWLTLDSAGVLVPLPSIPDYIRRGPEVIKIYDYFADVAAYTGKSISKIAKTFRKNAFFDFTRRNWTKGNPGDSAANLVGHFEKHGAEVGANNIDEYYKMANDFSDDINVYDIPYGNGDVVHFDPKTNKMSVTDKDNNIKTFQIEKKESKIKEWKTKIDIQNGLA